MTDIKTVTLQELQTSIKALEERIDKLEKGNKKETEKENNPAPAPAADVKSLLSQLDTADKKEKFKIRRQLRKAGYSLRDNGKK